MDQQKERTSVGQRQSGGPQHPQDNDVEHQRVNMEAGVTRQFQVFIKKEYKNPNCRNFYSGDKASRQVDQQLIPVTTTTTNQSLHLREHQINSYRCVLCQVRGHLWFPTCVFYRGDETTAGAHRREAVEETEDLSEFFFNEPKEEEASSKVHRREETQQSCTQERIPRIAHVLLDSSGSVEYPDWTKEDREDTKTASVRELQATCR